MNSPTAADQNSAQELYFLYELAKTFSSSLELSEVVEYILDGTCALVGTEQGFLCSLETPASGELPVLNPYILRGISSSTLQVLTPRLQPTWTHRQGVNLSQPGAESNDWKDLLAAPLIVRDQVHGILGVSTATARTFTPGEQQRLVSVANLAALALENARLHDRIQREVQVMRRLIHAAQQVGQGHLSAEQITELEGSAGWDEISQLSRVFAQMARQVAEREDALHQKVRELEIVIDEVKRNQQISEITETEYFRQIQQRARELRRRSKR